MAVTSKKNIDGTSRRLVDVDIAPGLDRVITLTESARNRNILLVSISPSADVLIHLVAIDCIVDVCGMSNSTGS